MMENIKLNIDEYESCGLGDIYRGLITFIERYIMQNYNFSKISYNGFSNGISEISIAIRTMKTSLKVLLDYLKESDIVFIPSLNRNINLKTLNQEEQFALEQRCKEYLLENLNVVMNQGLKRKDEVSKLRH